MEHGRGWNTLFPVALPAIPDWCVRRAQAPPVGKRGDEGGALGRVRCRRRMRTCLALVDSVDHILKKLSSLFAALVVDDRSSRRSAMATKCRNSFCVRFACSRRMRRRSWASWFPPRSWRSSQTTGGFAPTCATTKCMRMLSSRARGTWGRPRLRTEAHGRQGRGDASKAVQGPGDLPGVPTSSGSQGGEACQDRCHPSFIQSFNGCDVTGMPPAQLNEARLIARKNCREMQRLRFSCVNVRGSNVPALWMTKTLLADSERLRDCINLGELVNGPTSAVVASMVRFGWQVLSGAEFGPHKGVQSFASIGHGEMHVVPQDYDGSARVTDSRHCLWLAAASHCSTQAPHAALADIGERLAQGVFLGTMRTQNLEWLERFSMDRSCQLSLTPVGSLWHRCHKPRQSSDVATARTSTWTSGLTACRCRELQEFSGHDSCSVRTFPSPSGTSTSSGRCIQRTASSTREASATAPSGTGA